MTVNRLIFGCQSITGGSSLRASARILDCAFDLGITRFDVAPSYGLGTAERVLGRVLYKRTGIRVSTKVGIEPSPYGSIMSLVREPYRFIRRIGGKGKSNSASRGRREYHSIEARDVEEVRDVDVAHSLARSKASLGEIKIDALLTHEALGSKTLSQFKQVCELEIAGGGIATRGYSGGRASLKWNSSIISMPNCVYQCSFQDAPLYVDVEDLRLFGIVSAIAPVMENLANIDHAYAKDLLCSLKARVLGRREQFVASVAVACSLTQRASLIVSTSQEMSLTQAVGELQNSSLQSWAQAHKEHHAALIWNSTSDVEV